MTLLIGENIKRLRRELNLTQEELATHLGISFQSISKWERGEGYPDITMLPSLANYFNISIDELVGMSEVVKSEKYKEINDLKILYYSFPVSWTITTIILTILFFAVLKNREKKWVRAINDEKSSNRNTCTC